nr:MAG TPA: hypothetical protein [Bacteriophage sp.]
MPQSLDKRIHKKTFQSANETNYISSIYGKAYHINIK